MGTPPPTTPTAPRPAQASSTAVTARRSPRPLSSSSRSLRGCLFSRASSSAPSRRLRSCVRGPGRGGRHGHLGARCHGRLLGGPDRRRRDGGEGGRLQPLNLWPSLPTRSRTSPHASIGSTPHDFAEPLPHTSVCGQLGNPS